MPARPGLITTAYLAIGLTLSTVALGSYLINPRPWMRSCGMAAIAEGLAISAARSFFWAPEILYWAWFRQDMPAQKLLLPGLYPCRIEWP